MKKRIGPRRREKKFAPLTTTGQNNCGGYQVRCVETWNAKKVTLEMVKDKWFKEYPPEGYGTTVVGEIKDGILRTTMTRYKSCD